MRNVTHKIYSQQSYETEAPSVFVISDSLGDTASDLVLAAASQFSQGAISIERLPKAASIDQVKTFLDETFYKNNDDVYDSRDLLVFHTIADPIFRAEIEWELARRGAVSVDLLGPAVDAIAALTGEVPSGKSGVIRQTDARYFRRIEAMEFAVSHDDGRNPQDLSEADIVLIGVSRSSKTPLSMYLAFQGYKVANVPLAKGVEPPKELFEIEPQRIFGLISTTEVLTEVRTKRLGDSMQAQAVAAKYADVQEIQEELEEARAFMRQLGCIVIQTDKRAIEEAAQEILKYFHVWEHTLESKE